jgi:drug/metabolite transporter (DMT)-like permease
MTKEASLQEKLVHSDSDPVEHASSPAPQGMPLHKTSSVKHVFIVAGCIVFLLANALSQSYYVRYSSAEAQSGGTYLLCWVSSIFQVVIYPLHMLTSWVRHRVQLFRKKSSPDSKGLHSVSELIDRFHGLKRFLMFCLGMNALNFFGTYCWYLSLDMLPASFNFVVSKSAVVFAYLLSVPILSEAIDVFQGLVMLTITLGVICVAMGKHSQENFNSGDNLSLGLTMNLLQSVMSSLYNCLFKRFNPLPRPADVSLILTLQGLFTLLLLWPPLLFLEVADMSIIQAKPAVAQYLTINSFLAVSYYLAYSVGIVYSTASVMSISGTLKVPASAVIDAAVYQLNFPPIYIFGCVIVPLAVLAAFSDRARVKPWPSKFSWLSHVLVGRKPSK